MGPSAQLNFVFPIGFKLFNGDQLMGGQIGQDAPFGTGDSRCGQGRTDGLDLSVAGGERTPFLEQGRPRQDSVGRPLPGSGIEVDNRQELELGQVILFKREEE